ncbi:MAG: hypothetical protein Q8S54_07805 [Bacteroidota bacterium]|nr:hypothetical protein [Bacteroidota bacterium]
MLTLTLNGNNIPLAADFSMRLTWKSPACAFDKIPGSFGLGMSFPINEYTRSLFGFPERFAKYRTNNNQKFPGFEIRFGGVLLMAGTLTIDSASATSYEASLIDQVGVLGELEQERDLLDIPVFSREIDWVSSPNYNPDEHAYCAFPIVNHGFFTDKGLTVKRTVWETVPGKAPRATGETYDIEVMSYLFNKTTACTVNKLFYGSYVQTEESQINLFALTEKNNSYDTGKVTVVSPFFFLNYVIKEALKDSNLHIGTNFLNENAQLRNLCIYNNYDITVTQYLQTGEIIYHQSSPKNVPAIEIGTVGVLELYYSSAGARLYSYTRFYFYKVIPKNHLPKMKVGDLILSTQNLTNVCFHFLPDNTVNILSREKILTDPAIDLEPFFLGVWEIGEQKNVALKFVREHDSDDLVFAERFSDLSDRRADIKAPVANWTELLALPNPVEGEIRLMRSNNTFYEFRWITQEKVDGITMATDTTDVLGWEEISIGLQNGWHEFGRGEVEEIKSSWSTCYGNQLLTLVNQQGNMNTWKAKSQAFSPRLMINNPYNAGGTQNANFSFEYEKDNTGILPVYWKNWNRFWSNRLAVSGDFDLPVNVLRHVIYNICSKYRTREGEFLIEEMSCELFIDRIGTTQIKGFKV